MERIAFTMQIFKERAEEYKFRHDKIWPELKALLKQKGIHDYSIFLNEQTGQLFGCLSIADPKALDSLRQEPMMQKWWDYMKDIMETNPDHSPQSQSLRKVFYLP